MVEIDFYYNYKLAGLILWDVFFTSRDTYFLAGGFYFEYLFAVIIILRNCIILFELDTLINKIATEISLNDIILLIA